MENTLYGITPQFKSKMTNREYQIRLAQIRQRIPPSPQGRSRARTRHEAGEFFDMMIAETLRNIRKGEVEYCFNENQIVELLRNEPEMIVEYKRKYGIWEVFLPIFYGRERAG